MEVIIDEKSGFCFGVKNAIDMAEEKLKDGSSLYCLGDIVHNDLEVERLESLGLVVIDKDKYFTLSNCKVLIRAHGEPPETYNYAKENNIELLDGTCPVVLRLQDKIRNANNRLHDQGTIVIYGKPQHPEVIGLVGLGDNAVVVQDIGDLNSIDFSKPIVLHAQTTMNKEKYGQLKLEIKKRLVSPKLLEAHNSICGQVTNRAPWLEKFSKSVDVVIFVGGLKSSNSKVLFEHCKNSNKNSYFVTSPEEVTELQLSGYQKIGVCGATSTPSWLMKKVADKILEYYS
jgi:4-hydroxy-3-methylbut-2-enyl diphosphate reductase